MCRQSECCQQQKKKKKDGNDNDWRNKGKVEEDVEN